MNPTQQQAPLPTTDLFRTATPEWRRADDDLPRNMLNGRFKLALHGYLTHYDGAGVKTLVSLIKKRKARHVAASRVACAVARDDPLPGGWVARLEANGLVSWVGRHGHERFTATLDSDAKKGIRAARDALEEYFYKPALLDACRAQGGQHRLDVPQPDAAGQALALAAAHRRADALGLATELADAETEVDAHTLGCWQQDWLAAELRVRRNDDSFTSSPAKVERLDKALELAARSLYAASLVFHAKANDDDDSYESDEPDLTFGFKVSAATRDQLERGKGKLVGARLSVHDTVLSYIAHFMHAERVRATVFARWHAATYAPGSRAYERVQAAHAATGTIGA